MLNMLTTYCMLVTGIDAEQERNYLGALPLSDAEILRTIPILPNRMRSI
jgi:hypothetical protein